MVAIPWFPCYICATSPWGPHADRAGRGSVVSNINTNCNPPWVQGVTEADESKITGKVCKINVNNMHRNKHWGTSCACSLVLVDKHPSVVSQVVKQSLHTAVETTLSFKVHYSKHSIHKCHVYVCVYGSGAVGVISSHSFLSVGGEAHRSIKTNVLTNVWPAAMLIECSMFLFYHQRTINHTITLTKTQMTSTTLP